MAVTAQLISPRYGQALVTRLRYAPDVEYVFQCICRDVTFAQEGLERPARSRLLLVA